MSFLRREHLAPLLLLVAGLAFHWKPLFLSDQSFPWDFPGYHLPLAAAYADSLAAGELPLWEPLTYCGRPLAANPQAAIFYPPMLLTVLSGRQGLLERMEWLLFAHIYLAGVFTYFLARRLSLATPASMFSALVFMLGAFYTSQVQHLGLICASPWLPAGLLALYVEGRRRIACLAASLACMLLAGFTAFTVMSVMAVPLFAVGMARDRRLLLHLPLALLLGCGLASMQLGLTLELVPQSVGKARDVWVGMGGGMLPEAVLTMVLPRYFHNAELATYTGRADYTQMYLFSGWTALLALLFAIRRAPLTLWFFTLICGVLMLGSEMPIGRALYTALPPVVKGGTYWFVFIAPFLLGLVLLAGYGLNHWRERRALSWIASGFVFVELMIFNAGLPMTAQVIDGNAFLGKAGGGIESEWLLPIYRNIGNFRMDSMPDDDPSLTNSAPVIRWRTASGYDPLALEGIMKLRHGVDEDVEWRAYYPVQDPDAVALDLLSVRVLTAPRPIETERLEYAGPIPGRHMYLNPHVLSRYRAKDCNVRIVRERRTSIELETDCEARSLLETSEAQYSSWRVEVDDVPAAMKTVHGAFRAVALPEGKHRVRFYFSVERLAWLAMLNAGALAVWTILLLPRRSFSVRAK